MLSIDRALILRPKLMLSEEVSEGLAREVVSPLPEVLQQLKKDGIGVLLAEQNVQACLSTSNRVCVVLGGEIHLREQQKNHGSGAVDKYIEA